MFNSIASTVSNYHYTAVGLGGFTLLEITQPIGTNALGVIIAVVTCITQVISLLIQKQKNKNK